ncbi:MAG: hypothetical protein M3P18_07905, partial [Actinomycetota bacterium]|nr:hypothetical protein [Actinomycetota bacterium]
LRERDETALREAFDSLRGPVFGLAYHLLRNAALAEEVAQDVFLAIWLRPEVLIQLEAILPATCFELPPTRRSI